MIRVLACALLLNAELYLLLVVSGKALSEVLYIPQLYVTPPKSPTEKSVSRRPLGACLMLLCIGGICGLSASGRAESVLDRTRFVEFPSRIGEWQGHPALLDL